MAAPEFAPPEQFDEFRLTRPLGEGAMGRVYLCTDQTLHRQVAVKFLKVAATSETDRQRSLTEARAIARLTHPNVVTVYRVGEVLGVPYIASEYVEGTSLDKVRLPLPFERVLPVALGLARGLAAAHERGVLHRDIKPANIVMSSSGDVKLLDFGVAKLLEESSAEAARPAVSSLPGTAPAAGATSDALPTARVAFRLPVSQVQAAGRPLISTLASTSPIAAPKAPAAGRETSSDPSPSESPASMEGEAQPWLPGRKALSRARVGTPLYMSPEAWQGEAMRPQADIYSLGAVLFELCTGRPPHDAEDIQSLQQLAVRTDAPPLRSLAPLVPPWFAQIVDRCLSRVPTERYASGSELVRELDAALSVARGAGSSLAVATPAPSGRARAVLLAAVLAVSLAAGSYLLWNRPVSGMATLAGGAFVMGATHDEVEAAQAWCKQLMGSDCDDVVQQAFQREEPQRSVTLSPFRLDRREVTTQEFVDWLNAQRDLRLEEGRYVRQGGVLLADIYPTYQPFAGYTYDARRQRFVVPAEFRRRPATQVSWEAAVRYCAGQNKRLPTEAEWELAARGSEGRRFPWGYSEPTCSHSVLARLPGMPCAKERDGIGPRDVASTQEDRTPDGIYDLGGNVSEWVMDMFVDPYPACAAPCRDPVVTPLPERARVVRGGNWEWPVVLARGTTRSRYLPNAAPRNFGFRCAASLGSAELAPHAN